MDRLVVCMGSSTGGIEALRAVIARWTAPLPAVVLVVVHIADSPSGLPLAVSRGGPVPARFARDGEKMAAGELLFAPPGRHLVVDGELLRLTRGPRENGFRPAVDSLFRSAARSLGRRVVGVVLSGALDDGAAGLCEIRTRGGTTIVQAFDDARVPDMPIAAVAAAPPDYTLPAGEIGHLVERLARRGAAVAPAPRHPVPGGGGLAPVPADSLWPEPGGALRRHEHPERLVGHVDHAYAPDVLLARSSESLERALRTALRTLEENAVLQRLMALRARERGLDALASGYEARARAADDRADVIRRAVLRSGIRETDA